MMGTTYRLWTLAQDDMQDRMSWWDTILEGGLVGGIIIALSLLALGLCIMHLVQIRHAALMPQDQVDTVDTLLGQQDVAGAIEYCMAPDRDSFFTRIMGAALLRYEQSPLGAFELKTAVEEAGSEQTARLYRSTDAIGLIGTIAPLLGLLGTVIGMVGAFESLSRTAGDNHEALASNISLALVTTLMGLTLAIPCVALFTYFRNRIDALAADAGLEFERLTLHLLASSPQGKGS